MTPDEISTWQALSQDYKNKAAQIDALVLIAQNGYQADQQANQAAITAAVDAAVAPLNSQITDLTGQVTTLTTELNTAKAALS